MHLTFCLLYQFSGEFQFFYCILLGSPVLSYVALWVFKNSFSVLIMKRKEKSIVRRYVVVAVGPDKTGKVQSTLQPIVEYNGSTFLGKERMWVDGVHDIGKVLQVETSIK